jgi:hypothetical protein
MVLEYATEALAFASENMIPVLVPCPASPPRLTVTEEDIDDGNECDATTAVAARFEGNIVGRAGALDTVVSMLPVGNEDCVHSRLLPPFGRIPD